MSKELDFLKQLTTLQYKVQLTTPFLDYVFGRTVSLPCSNFHPGLPCSKYLVLKSIKQLKVAGKI